MSLETGNEYCSSKSQLELELVRLYEVCDAQGFQWIGLPYQVCTIGLSRQVFNNDRENVDRLTSLRLQYLMLILKEAVPSVSNISDQERSLILQMAGLQLDDSHFVCLCTCDLLMSSLTGL